MQITVTRADLKRLKAIAIEYECDARALVEIAIEELIAAHEKPKAPDVQKRTAKPAAAEAIGRSYALKPCAHCGKSFQPLGPRGMYCGHCRPGETPLTDDLEVAWNGAMGKNGTSLTGNGLRRAVNPNA
jgi:hypothetical protein